MVKLRVTNVTLTFIETSVRRRRRINIELLFTMLLGKFTHYLQHIPVIMILENFYDRFVHRIEKVSVGPFVNDIAVADAIGQ